MFYHGTSTNCGIDFKLMPPDETGNIQEIGRKKNTNKVFFTKDLNSASIYAGRAKNVFGGKQVIYRVIPMGEIVCLNNTIGSSVYYSDWAFVEEIK